MTKILIGVFTVFIFFLFLIPVSVFAQTTSPIPAPVLNPVSCSGSPSTVNLSWSGPPINNPNSWCNKGFIVDISTNAGFSSIYNKCVPGDVDRSYSTPVPDGFSGGLVLRSGLTYYVRVNNGSLSGTSSFTCPATGTQATPTPIPTPSPAPVITRTPSPTSIPIPVPTSISTPTISPTLNPIISPAGSTFADSSPSATPLTVTKVTTEDFYNYNFYSNTNSQTITLRNSFAHPVHLPVSDLTRASDVPVKFDVTYSDGTARSFFLTFHYDPKLNPKRQINSNDIPVDVFIHKSLTNQDEVANWAKDTINNYINTRFSNANIKHRLRVDQVIMNYDDQNGCPAGSIRRESWSNICVFNDNGAKIRVWLYKNGSAGAPPRGFASTEINQVWLSIPVYANFPGDDPLSEIDKRTLTHEIGHLFRMPDYYREDVGPSDNLLTPGIGLTPYSKDIMWSNISYDFFSETSKGFADRTILFPPGFNLIGSNLQYMPKNIVLKIIDNYNPAKGALVEVFPQTYPAREGGLPRIISPDVITIKGTTNDKGEINLGSYNDIFQYTGGRSAYIRITYNNQTRYAAFTLSYLNDLYFKGYTDTAILDLPFSSLTTYETGIRKALSAPGQISTVPSLSEQERQLLEEHIKQDLPTPQPTSTPNTYDLNNDGVVDNEDLYMFTQIFKSGKFDAEADFNYDGVINIVDYILLLNNFK